MGIGGGRAGRQPVALVTSTGVSFRPRTSTRPRTLDRAEPIVSRWRGPRGDEHRRGNRRPRSSAGGPGDEHGRQLHAPDLDQAPAPRPGRADRRPLVTNIDGTKPSRASAGGPGDEHDRQLHAPDLPAISGGAAGDCGRADRQLQAPDPRPGRARSSASAGGAALVTSIDGNRPSRSSAGGPGDEHGRQFRAPVPPRHFRRRAGRQLHAPAPGDEHDRQLQPAAPGDEHRRRPGYFLGNMAAVFFPFHPFNSCCRIKEIGKADGDSYAPAKRTRRAARHSAFRRYAPGSARKLKGRIMKSKAFPSPLHILHAQISMDCQAMGKIARLSHDSNDPFIHWWSLDMLTEEVGTYSERYRQFPAEFEDCLTRACDSVIDLCGSFGPNWHAAVSTLRWRVVETVESVMREVAPHVPSYTTYLFTGRGREPMERDPLLDEPCAFNLPGAFGFSWWDDAPPKPAGDGELLLCDRLSFLDETALSRAEAALSREFTLALDIFRESDNYPRLFAAAAEEIKPEPAADSNGTELVTLLQAAAIVNRSKRTLEKYKAEMPLPRVDGGGGKPDEWDWAELRPWLEQKFQKKLPDSPPRFQPLSQR